MACLSLDVFSLSNLEMLLRETVNPDANSLELSIDYLINNKLLDVVGEDLYTVSKEGLQKLYRVFGGLTYTMSFISEHCSCETIKDNVDNSIDQIRKKTEEIKEMLLNKNKRYGNSSLEPFGLFPLSRESKIEARMEDKLKRIQNIQKSIDGTLSIIHLLKTNENVKKDYIDAVRDLTGYLILYQIALEECL